MRKSTRTLNPKCTSRVWSVQCLTPVMCFLRALSIHVLKVSTTPPPWRAEVRTGETYKSGPLTLTSAFPSRSQWEIPVVPSACGANKPLRGSLWGWSALRCGDGKRLHREVALKLPVEDSAHVSSVSRCIFTLGWGTDLQCIRGNLYRTLKTMKSTVTTLYIEYFINQYTLTNFLGRGCSAKCIWHSCLSRSPLTVVLWMGAMAKT